MTAHNALQDILSRADGSSGNSHCGIFINETQHEVLALEGEMDIPRISVQSVSAEALAPVVDRVARVVPEYLRGHQFLFPPKPASETHFLHFVRHIKGQSLDFIHMFKLDFRFTSDMGTNHKDGTADFYPSYSTDRVLFSSCLIPVDAVAYADGRIADFTPGRISRQENVEADRFVFAHTIFDDFDPTAIHDRIYENVDADLFPFSRKMYPFLEYRYFTVVLRIPDPVPFEIEDAVRIYEPLYLKIRSAFSGESIDAGTVSALNGDLVQRDGLVEVSDSSSQRAKEFFSKYSLYQDDVLALKRWRRLDVAK